VAHYALSLSLPTSKNMSKLFRKEALEAKGQRLWGEVLIIQPPSFFVFTIVFAVFVSLIIALLFWGTYARKETVTGYLVPDTGLVKIYARGNGTVVEQLVEEGQIVVKGDKLADVSTLRAAQDISDIDQKIINSLNDETQSVTDKLATQQLLYQIEQAKYIAQIEAIKQQSQQLDEQQQTFAERMKLSDQHMQNIDKLLKKGNISSAEHEKSYEVHLALKLGFNDIKRQLTQSINQLKLLKFEQQSAPMRQNNQMTDLQSKRAELNRQILEIEGRRSFSLHAPIDGAVTALQIKKGKTININDTLMAILPEGASFEAQLFVPTRAVGFIKVGQQVSIRYTAFPYQRYGVYTGKVSQVAGVILSPDELPVPVPLKEPVYRITVTLDSQSVQAYGQNLPLQAGMLLEADIILDQLSLIDWLLDPLNIIKGKL
jgi:membrane fusion protein